MMKLAASARNVPIFHGISTQPRRFFVLIRGRCRPANQHATRRDAPGALSRAIFRTLLWPPPNRSCCSARLTAIQIAGFALALTGVFLCNPAQRARSAADTPVGSDA
jgi:hypothetical protein